MQFSAVDEVDSAFLVDRPVVYQDSPSIADVTAWASCILHEGDARYEDLFVEYLHVKNPEWSYEKEWRIAAPGRRPDDDELFGDYGFNPRELTAIYFGPGCPDGDRADFLKAPGAWVRARRGVRDALRHPAGPARPRPVPK